MSSEPLSTQPTTGPASGPSTRSPHKSERRLGELGFDPMQRRVDTYRRLEAELAWWEAIRDKTIVDVIGLKPNGDPKTRAYSFDAHMRIFEQLDRAADGLMRYAYGRVPETQIVENKQRVPFTINLTNGSKKTVVPTSSEEQT